MRTVPVAARTSEIIPAFAQDDGGDAGVEQRDVTEEAQRLIGMLVEQGRGEKTAEQSEDDDDLCVKPDGEEKGRDRDDAHQGEGCA